MEEDHYCLSCQCCKAADIMYGTERAADAGTLPFDAKTDRVALTMPKSKNDVQLVMTSYECAVSF